MFGGAPNPQNVTIVDWQTVQFGPPMMDVAYFVGTSFTAEDRRDVEVRLVEGYHASLLGAGVHDYSLAACWDDYARFSFQAVAVGMGAAMAVKRTDRGDQIFTSMVNRAVQQIVDHDALRFIK
jgi:aminoglycoside phosphotransferase (APT) family kinase protein